MAALPTNYLKMMQEMFNPKPSPLSIKKANNPGYQTTRADFDQMTEFEKMASVAQIFNAPGARNKDGTLKIPGFDNDPGTRFSIVDPKTNSMMILSGSISESQKANRQGKTLTRVVPIESKEQRKAKIVKADEQRREDIVPQKDMRLNRRRSVVASGRLAGKTSNKLTIGGANSSKMTIAPARSVGLPT